MRWILVIILLLAQSFAATAQDDKDRITLYLEDSLSGLGSDVQIEGFRGALSSRATMDKLTIADDDGVWLILTDAVLDWNRSAILGGRIEINELSAARIDVPRQPASDDGLSPEAGSFAMPDLPVSLRIDKISVKQVVLGEQVLGMPMSVSLNGAASLIDGQGDVKLAIKRLDGPSGAFKLAAGFSNETRVLAIDLSLNESADGVAANLLNLPGKPALELSVKGNSAIDDFTANVVLKSDGQDRLAGRIGTLVPETTEGNESPIRFINADIAGDLTPLMAPQYRPFFGSDTALKSQISLFNDGRISLDALSLTSAEMRVTGNAVLSADRLPEQFQLDFVLQGSAGNPVLLPLSGPETRVQTATLRARFDSRLSDTWTLEGDLKDLQHVGVNLDVLELAVNGSIQSGERRQITARIDGKAQGIDVADPALATALGTTVVLGADLIWRDGHPLAVSDFVVGASGVNLSGKGTIDGLDSAFLVQGNAQAEVTDLSRFSAIVGQRLGGNLTADLTGSAALLTGEFDMTVDAITNGLSVGIPKIDTVLSGESALQISALRDTNGLTLRRASVRAGGGDAEVSGLVKTGQSDLHFKAALKNVGLFIDGVDGPVKMTGQALENTQGWIVALDATGPNTISLSAEAALPKHAPYSAKIDVNIGSLTWLAPELAGAAQINATLRQLGEKWGLDARVNGPANSTLNVVGQIAQSAKTATLDLSGQVPLALFNRRLKPNSAQGFAQFDLRLDGPFALSSLSGQLRTSGARLALPSLRNALTDIDATVSLAGSNVDISATSKVATGGKLSASGRVGLLTPNTTDLALQVINVKVTDPQLYETNANGALSLSGPRMTNLTLAGRVVLDRTEIRVPSTGIDAFGAIPDITHLNEPAAVRRTRAFAGLLGSDETGGGGGGTVIGLDVEIIAQNRIFVRGRGLDAELGGQLRLTGTSANVIPQGGFDLIRGRLDILGKRLNLEEGSVRMQGDLNPMLRLVARRASENAVLFVIIEGAADAPEISFASTPDLPSEEILSRLLFGRELTKISPLQAVQLASAVATLAGRGGIGIVERLRQNTGFDDLDLVTGENGETSLRLGKYINEKAYTDVEIDSDGQSRINLNLDLSPTTILRGQLGTDGTTGIGLFFEKDY